MFKKGVSMRSCRGSVIGKRCLPVSFAILLMQVSTAPAVTPGQADSAIRAFNTVYWNASNKTFYKQDNKTGLLDFWMYAHAWETEMDAYERTHDTAYLHKIQDAYAGFTALNGTDWSSNSYNDDIAWWVLACTRAYQLTGDTTYGSVAKRNFDWVYATQCDTIFGGGIWWRNTVHATKNACVNNPMVIAAVNLYLITGDRGYLDKATSLYGWIRQKLFAAGKIWDNIGSNGQPAGSAYTYNQGTFIGAAYGLFKETGDSAYLREAFQTADYTRQTMCSVSGILPDEGTGNDAGCFKTVFVHHMMRLILDGKQRQYLPWMNANAVSVWNNRRRSDNIMWNHWATAAPTTTITSQCASGGVALLNLMAIADAQTGINRPINAKPAVAVRADREGRAFSVNGRVVNRAAPNAAAGLKLLQAENGRVMKHVECRGTNERKR